MEEEEEEEQNDNDNDVAADKYHCGGVVTANANEDDGGEEFDDDDDFDDDAFLPNATIDVEDEDQFVLDNNVVVDQHDVSGDETNSASEGQHQPDAPSELVVEQSEDTNNNGDVSPSDVQDDCQLQTKDSEQGEIMEDDAAQTISAQSSSSRVEDEDNNGNNDVSVAAKEEKEVNESVYDDDIQKQQQQQGEVIDLPTEEDEHEGIKSSLLNAFNGKNGGVAEDADLLAELRAISNKTSVNRFDGADEDNGTEEVVAVKDTINDAAPTLPVEEEEEEKETLPPWKQKKTSMKTSSTAFDVDVVVASAPAPAKPAELDPFENAFVEEKNVEPATTSALVDLPTEEDKHEGIKSSLLNAFNGKNGGVAEDADLLAELRAISNKTSVNRFDGADEDNGTEEVVAVKDTINDAAPTLPVEEEEEEKETLPPWKQKKTSMKTSSTAFDVDVVVASAPAPAKPAELDPFENAFVEEKNVEPATTSALVDLPTEEDKHEGIKSSLPNTFNGKNGGTAEDAYSLAELKAISNKASCGRFDGGKVDDKAQSSLNQVTRNERATTVKDIVIDTELPSVDAKKSDARNTSRPLPPWRQKGAAGKKKASSTAFNVDVVVAAAPAPAAISQSQIPAPSDHVEEPSACAIDFSDVEPPKELSMGIKSSLPNTFNGKNGGVAEDADLLAELKAISNKTSVNRFDVGEDDDDNAQSSNNNEAGYTVATGTVQSNEMKNDVRHSSKPLPPWKQKSAAVKKPLSTASTVDVVVAASPAPAVVDPFENAMCDESFVTAADEKEINASNTDYDIVQKEVIEPASEDKMGIKSSLPNTFNGKNGGTAEDADLLAELRAISNKASCGRFDGGGGEGEHAQRSTTALPPVEQREKSDSAKTLPPWKQKNVAKKDTSAVDIVIEAPTPAVVDSSENDTSNADIFRDNGNENVENLSKSKAFPVDEKPWKKKSKDKASGSLPPWKVKREKKNPSESVSDPFQNALSEEPNPSNTQSYRGSPHMVEHATQSTFSGKNGGAAEDADLLTELKAISSKSSNRFVDTNNPGDTPISESTEEDVGPSSSLPPWKQKAPPKNVNVDIDVVVSVPHNAEPKEENMGIKSGLPTTFKGKNGGTAEDADLLAQLRAISMKNSSNRFSGGDDEENEVSITAFSEPVKPNSSLDKPWTKNKPSNTNDSRPLPPWKQEGAKKNAFALEETDITVAAQPAANNLDPEPKEKSMGIKSNFTNTFKGDRGGTAEDADLLAELRAISKNSSSNRFADDSEDLRDVQSQNSQDLVQEAAPKFIVAPQQTATVQNTLPSSDSDGMPTSMNPFPAAAMTPFPTAPAAAAEINITGDGLDESLVSSNWQIRKASYLFLQEQILSALSGRESENQLSGEDVYSSLDAAVTKALGDKNAGALDSALTLSVTYADCCKGACSEDNASRIMALLLKGAAFASSRPSTLKATQELVLKLVEVAPDGSSTADNVVDLIQQHGLKAKKPKVVQFAATLVLKLVQEFGISVFNVSKLSAVHETLVANSNDKIRAVGIDVLAELCRTFGSKSPMQALVDKLKKSQQSQLDSLIDKQPTVTPPTRRHRCKRGVQMTMQSPEEALAALKKNEEEEKLKRFATRPAVNLLQVLSQTCYKDKIKEAKWSEKVAALNALIEAGGEQPYKISDGNYTTLLRELKQLLGHTHYLVCSKALTAIGMLAAGVGEPLSSDLRPLLANIVPLFKDKKVGKAVMSCLDEMFGNALRFDHFLGSNDSFLSSLDEKKEKNALVRKSVLEFLSRCVVSSGTCGTCGKLTSQHAEDLCKIACDKLKDSDATTRKAATDVLIALLNNKDKAIVSTVDKVASSLQSSNPRAYKTLQLATKSGKPDASSNGASRPGTAPLKPTSAQPNKPGVTMTRPTTAPKSKIANVPSAPAKSVSTSGTADENTFALPSLDESIDSISGLGISQWGDDADNGGVLAGIQCKI